MNAFIVCLIAALAWALIAGWNRIRALYFWLGVFTIWLLAAWGWA